MKYHLGCGSKYLDGYFNVDYPTSNHTVNNSVKADLYTDIMAMDYEPCSEIRSHHFFEHFGYVDAFKLLKKWTVALNKGGLLVIDVPDVERLSKAVLTGTPEKKFRVMRYMYGSQEAHWAYHINGWTKDTLEFILSKIGYQSFNCTQYGDTDSDYPNCGFILNSTLAEKLSAGMVAELLSNCLSVYSNGNTDFENRLISHLRGQML